MFDACLTLLVQLFHIWYTWGTCLEHIWDMFAKFGGASMNRPWRSCAAAVACHYSLHGSSEGRRGWRLRHVPVWVVPRLPRRRAITHSTPLHSTPLPRTVLNCLLDSGRSISRTQFQSTILTILCLSNLKKQHKAQI